VALLTAELVTVRRRGGELRLVSTDEARAAQIVAVADALQAIARAHVGRPRDLLDEAWQEELNRLSETGLDRRVAAAVMKLVRDACRFEEPEGDAATTLRRDLFRRAAAARRAGGASPFDRAAVLAAEAGARGCAPLDIEAQLYADRPGAQRLLAADPTSPAALAKGFAMAEAQAVLLRATKVRALVSARDAGAYRHLFRTLKFLRLLPVIRAVGGTGDRTSAARPGSALEPGYEIELDGPFSLFQGGTRYGLQLGLALPAIAACDRWAIDADVLWGAQRSPVRFRLAGEAAAAAAAAPPLPDELAAFSTAFARLGSAWRIDATPRVLDLPGAGLCVPDLAFVRDSDGAVVHLELLGYWSREAVWRRVDLVRAGLPDKILFAVSKSLRVGEAVLDDVDTAALYVFARVLSAKEVLARVERLAGGDID
jgi:predicted nuclease of restriction endonuclease-like RecB superfamily